MTLSVALVACAGIGVQRGLYLADPEAAERVTARFLTLGELEEALAAEDPALLTFLDAMEKAIPKGDVEFLGRAMDRDALMGRILDGLPDDRSVRPLRRGFESGTRKAWESVGILDGYVGAHYRFLRAREIDGAAGVLFRAAEGDDQIDYHLHLLTRDALGNYRVGDVYVVGLSECVSASLRRGFVHLMNNSLGEDVCSAEQAATSKAFVENLPVIGEMSRAIAERRFSEALDRYQSLPEQVRSLREIMVMRVDAAARLSPLSLYDSLEEWKDVVGGSQSLPLKFIDFHAARGEFDEAYELAKSVEDAIGGDPYLRVRIGELRYAIFHDVPALRFVRSGARNGRGKPEAYPTEGRR